MVSTVILTKNEEKNIGECLKTLEWCDEIIIIDDFSDDGTVNKLQAPSSNRKIYKRHLNGDFTAQRNFGLEKARGEWVLFVDADERVTSSLREEITQYTNKQSFSANNPITQFAGFYIKRKDFLFGRGLNHGETANIKLLRLAKKGSGEWVRPVHETWQVKGEIGELQNPLLHYPHQTVKEFLEDINFYTDLNAQIFHRQGVKTGFSQILIYPAGKFISNYIFKLGFLDGVPGLLMATFMSFHSFLTRAKLFLLWKKYA